MHYDVVIIGAGMSGLAAGIRAAYFDKRVCIFERHSKCGGLNSFYTFEGRPFDVGLHAVTNYAPPGIRSAPLAKLLRQLRLNREQFELCPQGWSEIYFPEARLRFTNDIDVLTQAVTDAFPAETDGFVRLLEHVRAYDDVALDAEPLSAREVVGTFVCDPLLVDMLFCPLMFYGNAAEHDMDFTQFVTMFKALFLEGLARPRGGVRTMLGALVKHYRACGGELRTRCGVRRLLTDEARVTGLELDDGSEITADVVLSSAGHFETMRLCDESAHSLADRVGQLSFVESISITDVEPAELGIEATLIFFNDSARFTYARPDCLVDVRSGVICCPNNFVDHGDATEGVVRVTTMADHVRWCALSEAEYERAKRESYASAIGRAVELGVIPDFRDRVVCTDIFTPRTIQRFTGHLNGAVYGAPDKRRDGRTRLKNLFLCGTDQGFLGIIGAMLSGISIANLHVLSEG